MDPDGIVVEITSYEQEVEGELVLEFFTGTAEECTILIGSIASTMGVLPEEVEIPECGESTGRRLLGGNAADWSWSSLQTSLHRLLQTGGKTVKYIVKAKRDISGAVGDRAQHIGGSGGSLEPPGPLFEPLGLFLRTSIPFIWRILSAFLRA